MNIKLYYTSFLFILVVLIYFITLNNIDSVFYNLKNKINEDIKVYLQCTNNNYNSLLCGRNKTKYTPPPILYQPHKSYISYIMLNLCKKYNTVDCSNSLIVIGILTRPEYIYERMVTRRIFKNIENIKYIFITGISANESINKLIYKEIILYSDLIYFNVINSYYNCSLIMSCFYMYMHKNCYNIKWVVKLDIDTYLNIKSLMKIIYSSNKSISVIGSINKTPRLICNTINKWTINCINKSNAVFQTPAYPFGPGFIFKFSSITCINTYFNNVKDIIWIEDVLFGILMSNCNLRYLDITKYTEITYKPKYNLSYTKNNIFVHGLHPIEIYLASKKTN